MRLLPLASALLLPISCLTTASPVSPQDHRETQVEAAHYAREIIDHRADGQGTLASIFPEGHPLAGRPAALMEYFAPGPQNGSLYMLLMPISHTIHNVFVDPAKEATFTIKDEQGERESDHGAGGTNRTRLEFWGNIKLLERDSDEAAVARRQYVKYHPDTKFYLPPHDAHLSYWARFDPTNLFYFGGFGDTHWIGMMDMDLYRSSGRTSSLEVHQTEAPAHPDYRQQQLLDNQLWRDW